MQNTNTDRGIDPLASKQATLLVRGCWATPMKFAFRTSNNSRTGTLTNQNCLLSMYMSCTKRMISQACFWNVLFGSRFLIPTHICLFYDGNLWAVPHVRPSGNMCSAYPGPGVYASQQIREAVNITNEQPLSIEIIYLQINHWIVYVKSMLFNLNNNQNSFLFKSDGAHLHAYKCVQLSYVVICEHTVQQCIEFGNISQNLYQQEPSWMVILIRNYCKQQLNIFWEVSNNVENSQTYFW